MGVKWHVTLLVLWVFLWCAEGSASKTDYSGSQLCDTNGCNCTSTAGRWKTINCTFTSQQKLLIHPESIPHTAIELSISGGYELIIQSESFRMLKTFNLLRVDGTKNIYIKKHAFDNLNSTSLDLQIVGCKRFLLENHAFKNMQTPIRAEISRCHFVTIENSAFSRLQEAKFQYVGKLELKEGAFTFENQGDIGRHGPVTNLSFMNVTIPTIPRATFTSALAEINIHDSEIHDIYLGAFRASQINAIFINNSTIHRLHSGALSEQTLIFCFELSKSVVHIVENQAIMAAITNFTVQFSFITEIRSQAINSTVANVVISDNKIRSLSAQSLIFHHWNRLSMDNNIIANLAEQFLQVPFHDEILEFSFSGNYIYNVEKAAFASMPELQSRLVAFNFKSNVFNQTCHCDITSWLSMLLNSTDSHFMVTSSFCSVDALLSKCFQIEKGLINMRNFTELVCGPGTIINCEPYNGETKSLDAYDPMLLDQEQNDSHLILVITLVSLLVIAIVGTTVILIIRSGQWCSNQGYCMRFEYNQNQVSNDDEAMVIEETSEKLDIPAELTEEILQELRLRLEDPKTHQEAQETIERLYEIFIVGDESYTNNNRQDEETHVYEELGNMRSGHVEKPATDSVSTYLKIMEDKISLPLIDADEYKPPLANEYSEPNDTVAVHLYSEPKNKVPEEGSIKSHTSNGSKMAFRPLPEKPKDEAGPSSQY